MSLTDREKNNVLHFAVYGGVSEICDELLDARVDVNHQNCFGSFSSNPLTSSHPTFFVVFVVCF